MLPAVHSLVDVISHADYAHRVIKTVSLYQATVVKITLIAPPGHALTATVLSYASKGINPVYRYDMHE